MSRTPLKPCPCCGGAAKEVDRVNANTVTCQSCGLTVKQSAMGMGDAADRWNTRPNEEALLAHLASIKRARHGLMNHMMERGLAEAIDAAPDVAYAQQAITEGGAV